MLVEERPRRDDGQEGQRGAAEADVEGLVNILRGEADEEGEETGDGDQEGGEEFGETLAFEVLYWS